jgi:hypothetical protein
MTKQSSNIAIQKPIVKPTHHCLNAAMLMIMYSTSTMVLVMIRTINQGLVVCIWNLLNVNLSLLV